MKDRYRLVKRSNTYYAFDRETRKRASLETSNRAEACSLLASKNQAVAQPQLNTAMARVYLSATDPKLAARTWQEVMEAFAARGKASSQDRSNRAFRSRSLRSLTTLRVMETTPDQLINILKSSGSGAHNYLKRLHNLALKRGWLLNPILAPADWPEPKAKQHGRGITADEHRRILEAEHNVEQRLFYSLLWEVGAAQSDAANLSREDIDEENQVLIYFRQKTGEKCQLSIGEGLRELLKQLPKKGYLFPRMQEIEPKHRSCEFHRRCKILGITGVTLHSYRYAWAERAYTAGYPERFAQAALGHKSRAVHRAYARRADVVCPSLDTYEKERASKIVAMTRASIKVA